jgi:hypothetical protein
VHHARAREREREKKGEREREKEREREPRAEFSVEAIAESGFSASRRIGGDFSDISPKNPDSHTITTLVFHIPERLLCYHVNRG